MFKFNIIYFFNCLFLKSERFLFHDKEPILLPTTHLLINLRNHFNPEYKNTSYPINILGIIDELLNIFLVKLLYILFELIKNIKRHK